MNKALIVVDYQVDFVNGSLGFENAKKLDDIISGKIIKARENGDTIIFTMDTHNDDYLSTQEGKKLSIKHCIKGSDGWQIYGKTAKLKKDCDIVFEKNTFGSKELMHYLENNIFSQIEICGLVSNICVLSNAVIAKAAQPECEIIVDASATDAPDFQMNKNTLDILEGIQVKIIKEEE